MDIEVNNDLYPFLFKLIISKTRVKNVTRVINLLRLFPFNNSQGSQGPKSNYNRNNRKNHSFTYATERTPSNYFEINR